MAPQKCPYAIRAVFELAKRHGQGPARTKDIARFLEVILNQLRRVGFVLSKRGAEGGYMLARAPDRISAGEIVQFMEGPIAPASGLADKSTPGCALHGSCMFIGMFEQAAKAVSGIYDQTSFQDLL